MGLFRKRKPSLTEEWYESEGYTMIADRERFYQKKGLARLYLSNLEVVPPGISYEKLYALMEGRFSCRLVNENTQDDIILYL